MNPVRISSPFVHNGASVTGIMLQVCAALLPGLMAYTWFFGPGIVLNIAMACATALLCEALVLVLRQRPVLFHLSDGSALVTAILFAVALPPFTPWWISVTGAAFAIIIVKQLYGGLGQNVFNPAMAGYGMALLAYPKELATWLPPHNMAAKDATDYWSYVWQAVPDSRFDAVSQATPLDDLDIHLRLGHSIDTVLQHPLYGSFGGYGWEWINIAFLAGGLFLLFRRVVTWHIPLSFLATLFLIAWIFHLGNSAAFAPPMYHLTTGAAVIGAFFIATDPVTAPSSPLGKILFGCGIAVIVFVIRAWGAYPDGVAFGVLLMNMLTPMLDQLTPPRIFGHRR